QGHGYAIEVCCHSAARSESAEGHRAAAVSREEEVSVLHIALFEPEIPPNTGNIARLCAATGTRLHLIGRLGFRLDDKSLQRAGLDYWDAVDLVRHVTFEEFERTIACPPAATGGFWVIETPSVTPYTQARFQDGDCLVFGSESKGLPPGIRAKCA